MIKTGQNVNDIKNANRSLILNILYFDGARSRKALAQKSNLTPAAITGLMSEMIAQGVVVETDKISTEGRLGRSEQLIDINYPSLYVIGIHFETECFSINLVRLDSRIIAKQSIKIISHPLDKNTFVSVVSSAIQGIIAGAAIDSDRVIAVGVTVRGIVDSENGVSIDSQGILEKGLDIVEAMNHLSFPVTVENDIRSMLCSDSILRHAKPQQSTLFIKYGSVIDGALLVGRKNYLGSNYRAIELGHVWVEATGDKCICGKKGCLEAIASFQAIKKNMKKIFSAQQTPLLFESCSGDVENLTLQKILSAYENDDNGVNLLMNRVIVRFAVAVVNCATLFDPETVLLASALFKTKKFTKELGNAISFFSSEQKPNYLMIADSHKLEKCGAASVAINNFLATGAKVLRDKNSKKG